MKIHDREEVELSVRHRIMDDHEMMAMMLTEGFPGLIELSDLELLDYVEKFGLEYDLKEKGVIGEDLSPYKELVQALDRLSFVDARLEHNEGGEPFVGIRKLGAHYEDQLWFGYESDDTWHFEGWFSEVMLRLIPQEYLKLAGVCEDFGMDVPDLNMWWATKVEMDLAEHRIVYVETIDEITELKERFPYQVFEE